MEQEQKLCDKVETVREFTYVGDRVSAGGGCEAAVTVRTRCGWAKFRECGELLYDRRFHQKLKWAVYMSYVRPAILHGSETWCLKESETIDHLVMVNSVLWNGHVLRREDGHVLRRALDFEVEGQRKKGRPKRTWEKQVEEESVKIGLRREDALY